MSTVRMPPILRQAVGGAREVDADGATVRELLDDLTSRYPSIRGHLLDDGGELNRFVNVYVNNEDVRLGQGLDTSVTPESRVIVVPGRAGGGRSQWAACRWSGWQRCRRSGTRRWWSCPGSARRRARAS